MEVWFGFLLSGLMRKKLVETYLELFRHLIGYTFRVVCFDTLGSLDHKMFLSERIRSYKEWTVGLSTCWFIHVGMRMSPPTWAKPSDAPAKPGSSPEHGGYSSRGLLFSTFLPPVRHSRKFKIIQKIITSRSHSVESNHPHLLNTS